MALRPDHDAAAAIRDIAFSMLRDLGRARRRLIRGRPDAEALHDYRVALRRIRSVLRALRPVLQPPSVPRLEKVLRRISRGTGPARDLEVLSAWVAQAGAHVPPALAAVLAGELERGARRSRRNLASVLRVRLHAEVVDLFDSVFHDPRQLLAAGPRAFGDVARAGALPAVATALEDADALLDEPSMSALHRLRISLKRVRYALEAFAGGWPPGVLRLRTTLQRLQDELGRVHDADLHAQWVVRTILTAESRRVRSLRRDLDTREIPALRDVLAAAAPEPAVVVEADRLLAVLATERDRSARLALRILRQRGLPGLERLRLTLLPERAPGPRRAVTVTPPTAVES